MTTTTTTTYTNKVTGDTIEMLQIDPWTWAILGKDGAIEVEGKLGKLSQIVGKKGYYSEIQIEARNWYKSNPNCLD